jgi:hypothetical protein
MAGKDATKPFRKNHNERILKTWQYENLCIGKVVEEKEAERRSGRFSKIMSWKRGGKKAVEMEVNVEEVEIEEERVEDVKRIPKEVRFLEVLDIPGKDGNMNGNEKGKGKVEPRNMLDVLSNDIALVAL